MARREEVGIDVIAKDLATREIQGVGRSLEGLARESEAATKKMGFLGNAITGIFQGVGQQIFAKLQSAFGALGDMAIGFNAKMEQARIGFTTMLGSAQKAEAFIDELLDFSKATPFQFEGLQKSANLIMAMGFNAKEVIPLLTAAGDAVAALGAGEDAVYRVVYALGQMRAAGRVTGQDMMQLASIGIPAWKMLADSMGLTVQQAKLMAEQGKIDAETAIKAITTAIEEGNMGGMMAAQSQTFEGAMSTVKDSITILVSTAFKPFFETLSAGTLALANFLSTEKVERFTTTVARVMRDVSSAVGELLGVLGPLTATWLDHIEILLPALIVLIGVKLVAALQAAAASAKLSGLMLTGIKVAAVAAIPFIGDIIDGFNELALKALRGGQVTRDQMTMVAEVAKRSSTPFISYATVLDMMHDSAEELGISLDELGEQIIEVSDRTGMSAEEALYFIENLGSGMSSFALASEEALDLWRESFVTATDEVAFSIKNFTAGLPEYMRAPIEEIMATVRTLPGMMSVTLADGTTLFASSSAELASMLPKKMAEARLAAIMEARNAPIEMSGAVLDTLGEWEDAWEQYKNAQVGAMTEAGIITRAIATLTNSEVIADLTSGVPAWEEAAAELMGSALATLNEFMPGFFTVGNDIDANLQAGVIADLRLLADAGDQGAALVVARWDAQQAAIKGGGARAGKGLIEGVETELTNSKGRLDIKFQTTLSAPKAYDWGKAIGTAWVNGINGGIAAKMYSLELQMGHLKRIMEGGSPPKEGPLMKVDVGGFNIGVAWVEGIAKGITRTTGMVRGSMGGLFPSDVPAIGGAIPPIGFGGSSGGFGGGITLTINNYFGAGSVRSEEDVREISRQTAERVRLLGVPLAQGQVGVIA